MFNTPQLLLLYFISDISGIKLRLLSFIQLFLPVICKLLPLAVIYIETSPICPGLNLLKLFGLLSGSITYITNEVLSYNLTSSSGIRASLQSSDYFSSFLLSSTFSMLILGYSFLGIGDLISFLLAMSSTININVHFYVYFFIISFGSPLRYLNYTY